MKGGNFLIGGLILGFPVLPVEPRTTGIPLDNHSFLWISDA